MPESYIQGMFAGRIGGSGFGKETVIYKFEKIKRAKRQALHDNPRVELIDLGVGEPDWAADPAVVEVLRAEAGKNALHQLSQQPHRRHGHKGLL
jgi:LL-diaminopimelate aminotransferase